MHIRREIDGLLDEMLDLIEAKKESNSDTEECNAELQRIERQINNKTDEGKRARGMWTESPEFNYTNI